MSPETSDDRALGPGACVAGAAPLIKAHEMPEPPTQPPEAVLDVVRTDRAPTPRGHYSQAVVHDGLVYVAGQLPGDPDDPDAPYPSSVQAQTERVLAHIGAILEAAGSSLDRVLQMTVYVADADHWPDVNEAYGRVMGAHRPARAIVPVKDLKGAALEVQAIAAVG